MLKRKSTYLLFLITLCSWGFSAHKDSHAIAITGLPSPLFDFCNSQEDYIISEAVAADRRKFTDTSESIKHYIDLDYMILQLAMEYFPGWCRVSIIN